MKPESKNPIGEAWIVFDECTVDGGPWDGSTLADIAHANGIALLGERVVQQTGNRVPLLIKLLDAQDWLSVQVHPNDEQARRYEGPDEFGKTEAWYLLEADEDARLVSGLAGTPTRHEVRSAAEDGTLERLLHYENVSAGDVVFIPAGRVHAIGPGLLIYEVQQTSDTTYRLFDWNRPSSAGRELHLDRGIDVVSIPSGEVNNEATYPTLVTCPYFTLDEIVVGEQQVRASTEGRTFHALTVISGEVTLNAGGNAMHLEVLETVLVPASTQGYELVSSGGNCRLLRSRVT